MLVIPESNNESMQKSSAGRSLTKSEYVAEPSETAAACGPACILSAYNFFLKERNLPLNENNKINLDELLDILRDSPYRTSLEGQTGFKSRKFLVNEMNRLNPENPLKYEIADTDRSPEAFIESVDSNLESGNLVVVSVGRKYLLEILRQEVPFSEIAEIDSLISEFMDIKDVLSEHFSFEEFHKRISKIRQLYGQDVYENTCIYVGQKLSEFKENEHWQWSLQVEKDYVRKMRENVIDKILPPQNVTRGNIEKERKRRNIPDEGLNPGDRGRVKRPPLQMHGVLVHGIARDSDGEESYIISDPIVSYGPNRVIKKSTLYDVRPEEVKGRFEVISKIE